MRSSIDSLVYAAKGNNEDETSGVLEVAQSRTNKFSNFGGGDELIENYMHISKILQGFMY